MNAAPRSSENELASALEQLLAFEEPDSIADQQNDVRLREERQAAVDHARMVLEKARP